MKHGAVRGYILHARPWRETSLLLDLWTERGRLSAISRGARRPRRTRSLLQPMQCLALSWVGRGEVKTLTGVDTLGSDLLPTGRALYCGFYANELIVRTVLPGEMPGALFVAYHELVQNLQHLCGEESQGAALELPLRTFELQLLHYLGYGINLERTARGEPLHGERHYEFRQGEGLCESGSGASHSLPGRHILDFARGEMHSADTRRSVRNLLRSALQPLLGSQPLYSRDLFRSGQ